MARASPPGSALPGLTPASRWAWVLSTVAALGAAVVLASLLVGVIVVAAVRLLWRVARGRFGSRLLLKLAAIFALVGVVPGVLIYTVSYQFVSRSIESWFDVKVEGALDAGLNLGRGTIDSIVSELGTKSRGAAGQLADSASSAEPLSLERLREQLSAREI